MSRFTKSPQNNQKATKTEEPTRTLGKMKMVDGVAVMLPPDSEEEILTEEDVKTIIASKSSSQELSADTVVSIQVDEEVEDNEFQQVYDTDSEAQSRRLAAQVRKENDERADKAAIETKPKKVGDTIVAQSDSFDDIDMSLLDEEEAKTES